MFRLIKDYFYYRLAIYHYKKANKYADELKKHRELGIFYHNKHSKV